jgi:hypothetical protein
VPAPGGRSGPHLPVVSPPPWSSGTTAGWSAQFHRRPGGADHEHVVPYGLVVDVDPEHTLAVTTPRYWVTVRPSIPGVVVTSIAVLLPRSRCSPPLARLDGVRMTVNRGHRATPGLSARLRDTVHPAPDPAKRCRRTAPIRTRNSTWTRRQRAAGGIASVAGRRRPPSRPSPSWPSSVVVIPPGLVHQPIAWAWRNCWSNSLIAATSMGAAGYPSPRTWTASGAPAASTSCVSG